jgi:membrane protease YdiL (CAAX protease family)
MDQQRTFFLDGIHEASWGAIAFVFLIATASVIVFLWVSKLFALPLIWIVCIGVGIFLWGRQKLRDVGLTWRNILPGIAYAIVWWAVTVGGVTGVALVRREPVQWPVFNGNMGPLIKQLLIFALAEEIIFRGFIMAQLYRKLRRACSHSALALTAAILISQLYFALWHIPHRLMDHEPAAEMATNLALIYAGGVLFSLVYLRTGNLLTALGVHAVSNLPGLCSSAVNFRLTQLIMFGTALILADLYARLGRKQSPTLVRGSAATASVFPSEDPDAR